MKGSARVRCPSFVSADARLVDSCRHRDRQLSTTNEGKRADERGRAGRSALRPVPATASGAGDPDRSRAEVRHDQAGGKAVLIAYYGLFALFRCCC